MAWVCGGVAARRRAAAWDAMDPALPTFADMAPVPGAAGE